MHDTDEKKGTSEPLIVEVPSSQPGSLERNSNDPSTSGHNKWRWTTAAGTLTATLVLVLNVVCYVIVTGRYKVNNGFATVYSGDCSEMRSIDTWSSLAINVLSTMLLAASNNGMQCLSAPTRPEISRAHAKGTWLDIGVSSIRNLKHIHGFRVFLWICLGLSSVPLHLMYVARHLVKSTGHSSRYLTSRLQVQLGAVLNSLRQRLHGYCCHEKLRAECSVERNCFQHLCPSP